MKKEVSLLWSREENEPTGVQNTHSTKDNENVSQLAEIHNTNLSAGGLSTGLSETLIIQQIFTTEIFSEQKLQNYEIIL